MTGIKPRLPYLAAFVLLLGTEILIGCFVRDRLVRPYGGDILAAALLCCLMRAIWPDSGRLLPLWVFLFCLGTELLQLADLAGILGIQNRLLRVVLGSTFDFADILCYFGGCLLFAAAERGFRKRRKAR